MKYVYIPWAVTIDKLPKVQKLAKKLFVEKEGVVLLYGKITGFIWVYSPTEAIRLDIGGDEVSRLTGQFHPPDIRIQDQR